MIKKMSYIKLKTFKQNVPSNYQSNVLFSKLPYLANIKIPAFQNFVIDVIDNRTDLQEFLLATNHIGRNIQESMYLVVRDGKLNNAAVCRLLL